jgi:hypothetical protein
MDPIQRLARRIRAVEKLAFRAATQPQLAHSSIEDGAIQSVEDGSLKAIIGKQFDGTQAITLVNGPTPPIPTVAGVVPALEGAILSWDGLFADGSIAPMDFSRVEVHASTDPDFTAESADTLKVTFETPRGGEVFVSLPIVEHYVRLVARTTTGARSEGSTPQAVTPLAVSDALPPPTDGAAPTSSPTPLIAPGIGTLFVSWAPVANDDPTTYDVHVSDTNGFTPDSSTLAGDSQIGQFVVRTLPDGTPLSYTAPTYVRIVAKDSDGPGPASTQASGTPIKIDTDDLADNAVEAAKIASEAVTTAKIALEAITSDLIAAGAVTEVEIADDAITAPKILAGAITAGKIAADSITANEIAADSITASELAADAVTSTKVAAAAITAGKIAASAVTSAEIAAGAITAGHIAANEITADKFAATLALVSQLLVGDKISINPTGPNNGIRIELNNGGHIYFPADGSNVDLKKVSATFTDAIVENNLQIIGPTNRVGGVLTMDASVTPPTVMPTALNLFDQAPVSTSVADSYVSGLGDNGTTWQTGKITNWNTHGQAELTVYNINRSTGARTVAYSKWIQVYTDLSAEWSYTPSPQPSLASFTSNGTYSVFVLYCPRYDWAWSADPNISRAYGDGTDGPTDFRVVVVRHSDQAIIGQFHAANFSDYYNPGVFTDGTYVYYAACGKGTAALFMYRWNLNGSGLTTVWTSGAVTGKDLTSVYVGNGDFGSPRHIISAWDGQVYSYTPTGTHNTTEDWTATTENCRGVGYYSGNFYSHTSSSRLFKHSTLKSSAIRAVKFTWYKTGVGTESTASPTNSITQNARQWLRVTTSAIPASSNAAAPDSARIYIDSHRQADLGVGVVTTIYEVPSIVNGNSPAVNGFAALNTFGKIVSEATLSGSPKWAFNGDGTGRYGAWRLDSTTESTLEGSTITLFGSTYNVGSTTPGNVGNTITVTSPGTWAVYMFEFCVVGVTGAGVVNFCAPAIDGAAWNDTIRTHATQNAYFTVSRTIRVTGLAAGTHTFGVRSWNNAAGTTQHFGLDSTITVQRII